MKQVTPLKFLLKCRKGFTVLELIVVLGLFSLTLVALIPIVQVMFSTFEQVQVENRAKNISETLLQYIKTELEGATYAEVTTTTSAALGFCMYTDVKGDFVSLKNLSLKNKISASAISESGDYKIDVLFTRKKDQILQVVVQVLKQDEQVCSLDTKINLTGLFDFAAMEDGVIIMPVEGSEGKFLIYKKEGF